MGNHFSYVYTKVEFHVDKDNILLGNFEFKDEHGHRLKSVKNVLLRVRDGDICMTDGDLFVADEECFTEYWIKAREKYAKNYPDYDVYNNEDLYKEYQQWRKGRLRRY
jgi:hypothetical protein